MKSKYEKWDKQVRDRYADKPYFNVKVVKKQRWFICNMIGDRINWNIICVSAIWAWTCVNVSMISTISAWLWRFDFRFEPILGSCRKTTFVRVKKRFKVTQLLFTKLESKSLIQSTAVFLNRWAVDNFQRASNLDILLSFTTELYNFLKYSISFS